MTLLDAKPHDEARSRRRRNATSLLVVVILIFGWLAFHFRNYSERSVADRFFAALQKQDYEGAYGIWFQDPSWRQHKEKYSNYNYSDFYRDWGPGGEWGLIKSHTIDCSLSPSNSGIVVQVTVNGRA